VALAQSVVTSNLREQMRKLLLELLQGLFDCTDDALFELADRSSTDEDHHLYFHSMRQIRLQRAEIERKFIAAVFLEYDRLLQPQLPAAESGESLDLDAITLLQGDDLEVSVAVSGIVSKVTSQFSLPIMELTKRLGALCAEQTLTERTNPLGPQKLCDAFVAAIENLEVDIRVRLILLKLFERLVMQNMLKVYNEANDLLVQAGVLPDLKRRREAAQPRPKSDQATPAEGSADPSSGSEQALQGALAGAMNFGFIQNLLSGIRGNSAPLDPNLPVLQTAQLLNVLNAAQLDAMELAAQAHPGEPPRLPNLHQLIAARATDLTGQQGSQLRRADDDVVNFIGMLFDYVLNDRNLAIPMKALIARLQIPIVKVAIMDKAFFEKSAHPARQLLNELSSIGIGWSSAAELKRDHVYDTVESVVARVLNDFNQNPEIFANLLEELRAFRQRDEQRHQMIETRVRQTEAGKARNLASKQIVQQLINQKASGLRLPPEAGRFISEVWSRVLVYTCLKHGTQSPEWQKLGQVLDDLLWCLQPLQSLPEIERREALIDALMSELDTGVETLQLPASEAQQWLEDIERLLNDINQNDRTYLADDLPVAEPHEYTEMEEIVLATVAELGDPYTGASPDPAFIAAIDQLSEGVWIELDQDGTDPLRCKLTAIVDPGARYVFVNRRGMKVLERSRMELARELQDGRMRILNDSQVFDRALQTVIGNLRQMQARPSA